MIYCPVCHHSSPVFKFKSSDTHGHEPYSSDQFDINFCPQCQAYFPANITIDDHYYQTYYPKAYYPQPTLLTRVLNYLSFTIKKNLITQHFPNNSRLSVLDIGCGQGEFLEFLPPTNFLKFGVELNPTAIKMCQSKGIKIIGQDIDGLNSSQKFDCITLWHVLEHLPHPQKSLKKISSLIKPNGLLIMALPYSSSLGFRLGKANYFHLDSPRHLFIPNVNTIKYLLKSSFGHIRLQSVPSEYPLDLFWSLRSSPWRFLIYPLYPLIKAFSPETIFVLAIRKS